MPKKISASDKINAVFKFLNFITSVVTKIQQHYTCRSLHVQNHNRLQGGYVKLASHDINVYKNNVNFTNSR